MTDADSCASRLSTVAGFCLGTIIIAPSLVGYAQGGRVENVRVEQVSLQGLVVIRYDLLSDQPQAVFEVRLEISVDDGETFSVTPSSVSGDIGADIPPGSGKRIVWESGREVAQLQADRLQARITLQTTSPAETLPLAAQGTVLTVNSVPTGATVSVDGATRGRTPLNLEGLSPGEHRIILALDGFLEHSRRVVMAEGQPELVLVTLTEIVEGALTGTSLDPEPSDGGISSKTLVLLGLAGGGAATIAALVGGSEDLASLPPLPDPRVPDPPPANTPPQGGSFTVNPTGVGLAFATNFQFSAIGVTDPDGDPITYFWEFGDGSGNPPSAATVFKTYTEARQYSVGLGVTDNKSPPRLVERQTVNVKSLAGRWSGHIGGGGCSETSDFITLDIVHSGSTFSGSYSDDTNGSGSLSGSVTDPRAVSFTHMISGFRTGTWTGSADTAIDTISGSVDWFTCGVTDYLFHRE